MQFRAFSITCTWVLVIAGTFTCGAVLAKEAQPGLLQLAHAYRETERSLEAFPFKSPQECADCNRAMDRVALHFFSGSFSEAIHAMHDIALQRTLKETCTDVDRAVASLELEITPNDWVLGTREEPRMRLRSLYPIDLKEPLEISVVMKWTPRGRQPVTGNPVQARLEPNSKCEMEIAPAELHSLLTQVGSHESTIDVEVMAPTGSSAPQLPFNLVSAPLESIAATLRNRLQKCPASANLSSEALLICERRIALLDSKAERDQISRWTLGTIPLKQAIDSEIEVLEQGNSPYRDTRGDIWMSLSVRGTQIPVRVYRPITADPGETLPVVIALHGAGGNEHMFFETLGNGRIKKLAEQFKFIAVSPATIPLLTNQQLFPIFLDELASTSATFQASLLRVLQSGEARRVGATETTRVNVRVIGASNAPLRELAAVGGFRADLFYRLSVLTIDLPPLRERNGDVSLLARHFLRRLGAENHLPLQMTEEAEQALCQHSFPGNVRELENALISAAALANNGLITLDCLPSHIAVTSTASQADATITEAAQALAADWPTAEELQRRYIQLVLDKVKSNRRQAAILLGMNRRTIQRLIAKHHFTVLQDDEPDAHEDAHENE